MLILKIKNSEDSIEVNKCQLDTDTEVLTL